MSLKLLIQYYIIIQTVIANEKELEIYKEENEILRSTYIDAVNYRYQYQQLLDKYKNLNTQVDKYKQLLAEASLNKDLYIRFILEIIIEENVIVQKMK